MIKTKHISIDNKDFIFQIKDKMFTVNQYIDKPHISNVYFYHSIDDKYIKISLNPDLIKKLHKQIIDIENEI